MLVSHLWLKKLKYYATNMSIIIKNIHIKIYYSINIVEWYYRFLQ